jgi:hypothetical protein
MTHRFRFSSDSTSEPEEGRIFRTDSGYTGKVWRQDNAWHACLTHKLPDYSLKTILNIRVGYWANATGATMKEACERSIERFEQL